MQVEWIPCEERLPPISYFYWVGWFGSPYRRKPTIGEWLGKAKIWYLEGHYRRPMEVLAPTHWAEIEWPEPPTEEAALKGGAR